MNDFIIDAKKMPSFVATGPYRVDFAVLKKDVLIFRMVWYATLTDN